RSPADRLPVGSGGATARRRRHRSWALAVLLGGRRGRDGRRGGGRSGGRGREGRRGGGGGGGRGRRGQRRRPRTGSTTVGGQLGDGEGVGLARRRVEHRLGIGRRVGRGQRARDGEVERRLAGHGQLHELPPRLGRGVAAEHAPAEAVD